MKKLAAKILLLILVAGALGIAWTLFVPLSPGERKFVMLRPGWPTRRIAAELDQQGVIRSRYSFLLLHMLAGRPSLKAGEYLFERSASAVTIQRRLARGDIYVHTVVIPEGFNIFDIAAAMEAAGLSTRDEFLNLALTRTSLIADLDLGARSLEGFLYPDTYQFTRTQSLEEMIGIMVKRFRQEAQALGLTKDFRRVVTLASVIEKETSVPEERPLVAGVYANRLRHKMALQADPSVIYANLLAGRYRGGIYRSDLELDSPYNTYRYAGLPPGPIANPGRDSLQAAMNPAATKYLYFVSDAHGRHRFATNIDDHNRNVVAYRRAMGHSGQR